MEDKEQTKIKQKELKQHPKKKYSALSHFLFWWQLRLVINSWKKGFPEDHLCVPYKEYESKPLGDKLEQLWNEEENFQKNPSLAKILLKLFGTKFLFYGFLMLPAELANLTLQPLLLKKLLDFYTPNQKRVSLYQAYLYTVLLALVPLFRCLVLHSAFLNLSILGMNIKTACSSLIYRKALKLKQSDLKKVTIGQMVNLLSNDVNRFDSSLPLMPYLWNAPAILAGATCYIYFEFGLAALSGVGVVLVFLVIQMLTTKQLTTVQKDLSARTDLRIRFMNDVICGIQTIKLYTWEEPFKQLVDTARRSEMKQLLRKNYLRLLNMTFKTYLSKVCLLVPVLIAVLTGQQLTPQYIFGLSSFYDILKISVFTLFQHSTNSLVEITTSVKRMQNYLLFDRESSLLIKESNTNCILKSRANFRDNVSGVYIRNVTAKWDQKSNFVLKNVNFHASPGDLVGVIGIAGSGKSTLLHIILQEIETKGDVDIGGKISYASQEPWIFPASIKQNILFGENFDLERYTKVIEVCALEHDLPLFAHGDQTLVGERGVMLSGGQKARINLARAVYKDVDIYLFDDPLSAVDANVAQQIFNECICGYLKKKCTVLVTHQIQYLQNVDKLYVVESGGVFESVSEKKFENLEKYYTEQETRKTIVPLKQHYMQSEIKEHKSLNTLESKVYLHYIKAVGQLPLTCLVLIIFVMTQVLISTVDYFLSFWVNLEQKSIQISADLSEFFSTDHCLYIYVSLVVLVVLTAHVESTLFTKCCHKASQGLHNTMLFKIIYSGMTFFNQHSSGRILNRFTTDLGSIDENIPLKLMNSIINFLVIIGVLVLIIYTNYWMIFPAILLLLGVYFLSKLFQRVTSNVKRTVGTTRSCLFTHLSASLQGLTTIRALEHSNTITEEFDRHQDFHTCAIYLFRTVFHALGFWIDIICSAFGCLVRFSFFFLSSKSNGTVGLALTQTSALMGLVQITMKFWEELQGEMISVERVLEYAQLNTEEDNGTDTVPEAWPQFGNVSFNSVSLRHVPDKPLVLKNISFTIKSGEKVGIVGRTGAGKTSLISALFRLFHFDGSILIDGIDTKCISLNQLRSKIAAIPQEPVLFLGTLRENIDPFKEYSDTAIWNCLEETDLKRTVTRLEAGLNSAVSERGSNFSVGQRQLLCLVRAMLRKTKIIVLDEATANVDLKTDEIIQTTIRKNFCDCTVLTIAHRLNTVIDSDKILVLEDGAVVEFGHPHLLLRNTEGFFYKYMKKSGSATMSEFEESAEANYQQNREKNRKP